MNQERYTANHGQPFGSATDRQDPDGRVTLESLGWPQPGYWESGAVAKIKFGILFRIQF